MAFIMCILTENSKPGLLRCLPDLVLGNDRVDAGVAHADLVDLQRIRFIRYVGCDVKLRRWLDFVAVFAPVSKLDIVFYMILKSWHLGVHNFHRLILRNLIV